MSWLLLVGTLLGTMIGSTGTIISQYLAGRAAERRERLARAAEYRAERRQAIEAVFETGQEIERVASDESDRPSELTHRLWFLHARLSLIASDQLQGPLDEFADALTQLYWNGAPDGEQPWEYLQGPRYRFRDAARSELATFEYQHTKFSRSSEPPR